MFASMGLRPPRVHALASGWTELGAGAALLAGFLVPLQCDAVIGVMAVAAMTAHRTNGVLAADRRHVRELNARPVIRRAG